MQKLPKHWCRKCRFEIFRDVQNESYPHYTYDSITRRSIRQELFLLRSYSCLCTLPVYRNITQGLRPLRTTSCPPKLHFPITNKPPTELACCTTCQQCSLPNIPRKGLVESYLDIPRCKCINRRGPGHSECSKQTRKRSDSPFTIQRTSLQKYIDLISKQMCPHCHVKIPLLKVKGDWVYLQINNITKYHFSPELSGWLHCPCKPRALNVPYFRRVMDIKTKSTEQLTRL
jgi:hypothetical protein